MCIEVLPPPAARSASGILSAGSGKGGLKALPACAQLQQVHEFEESTDTGAPGLLPWSIHFPRTSPLTSSFLEFYQHEKQIFITPAVARHNVFFRRHLGEKILSSHKWKLLKLCI